MSEKRARNEEEGEEEEEETTTPRQTLFSGPGPSLGVWRVMFSDGSSIYVSQPQYQFNTLAYEIHDMCVLRYQRTLVSVHVSKVEYLCDDN
jgi:hypothetical protein